MNSSGPGFSLLEDFLLLLQSHCLLLLVWAQICLTFLSLLSSVLLGHMHLKICPLFLGFQIQWDIIFQIVPNNPLIVINIYCDVSNITSNFIYLGLFTLFINLTKGLSILFIFAKNCFIDCLYSSFSLQLIYLYPDLYCFFLPFYTMIWGLVCSCFPKILRYIIKFFVISVSHAGTRCYKFPLSTAFALEHRAESIVFPFSPNLRNF